MFTPPLLELRHQMQDDLFNTLVSTRAHETFGEFKRDFRFQFEQDFDHDQRIDHWLRADTAGRPVRG